MINRSVVIGVGHGTGSIDESTIYGAVESLLGLHGRAHDVLHRLVVQALRVHHECRHARDDGRRHGDRYS